MTESIRSVRGMHDLLPEQAFLWRLLETRLIAVLEQYGYEEIRLPIVEKTAVFLRSLGETTDVVKKEMYSFPSGRGESLTLRPEGTAGCVRSLVQHHVCSSGKHSRLWYLGPMFRHENPQRGRCRQFHQLGVEAFNLPGPEIEAEIISLGARFFQALKIQGIRLEINTLGSPVARQGYRQALVEYFSKNVESLDDDSRMRLAKNPLRILDSKAPKTVELVRGAPRIETYLDDASRVHFSRLQHFLDQLGIDYTLNPHLVRGLDYYIGTVFEWISNDIDGAQNTLCAGGRYDDLFTAFGGKTTPAVGMALGLERVVMECQKDDVGTFSPDITPLCYLIALGDDNMHTRAMRIAERMRDAVPALRLIVGAGTNLKKQLKQADRSAAAIALIFGENEYEKQYITWKPLRTKDVAQEEIALDDLAERLEKATHNPIYRTSQGNANGN